MRQMVRCLVVAIILLMAPGATGAADVVWVTSSGAKLKADRSAVSETVVALPVGTKLEVIRFEGRWFNVAGPDGKTGWIYRGKVSRTAPEGSGGEGSSNGLGTLLGGLSGSKIGSDTPDTDRSIRALKAEKSGEKGASSDREDAEKALERVMTFGVTDQEIEWFLETGGIGEYAR